MQEVLPQAVSDPDPSSPRSGSHIVVSTKINKPILPSNCITRPGLFDRLEKNLHLPLTLVSAATGCGKSTTISQWLENTHLKYGWLSLDHEHNDIQVLLDYLVAVLNKVWPAKSFGLEYLLNGLNVPVNAIITAFINDIARFDEQFVLVLDDYHLIREEKIHEIFNGILSHPPNNLHLVIVTQIDPPLKLARLRAKLQLNELRMKDLAFTIDEAYELRSLIAGKADNKQVESLTQKSEGWVTGITVGLMGLAQGIKIEKVLEALSSRNSIIAELLDEAVLHGLPIETQKYLELASLVDRFSADLVSFMIAAIDDNDLDQNRVEELIRTSRKSNLFLIPLDNSGEWFRFHHLFQSQVRKLAVKHFNQETVGLLFKAASGWFEKKELWEEALRNAVKSNDMPFAVKLFARYRHELHNTEQIRRLERLINQFPEEVIDNHLELLLSLAKLQVYSANFADMQKYLSRAEELLKHVDNQDIDGMELQGEWHSVSNFFSFMHGDLDQAIMHAEKAMELLPADKPYFFREFAVGWYSYTQQTIGNAERGLEKLESELQNLAKTDPYFKRRLLQGSCMFQLLECNITLMNNNGAALSKITGPNLFPNAWVIGIYCLSCSSYLCNDLERVGRFHDDLHSHRFLGLPFWVMHHFFLECLSAMGRRMWEKVDSLIRQCEEFADDLAIEPLKGIVIAFKIESYLRRNEIDHAIEIAALANFEPHPLLFFYYIPQLTQVKLLYRTNQKAKGKALLQNIVEEGRLRHNRNLLTQALALQAVIHASEGNIETAKKVLNDALMLTKDTKNIRVFLDLGEAMLRLLKDTLKDEPESSRLHEILQAFEDEMQLSYKDESTPTANREKQLYDLSNREFEILALVARGLKNDEIADQLFISTDTVKKHLYNAYQKLEVKNRTGAIIKVKELGFVTKSK